jgi:hypothetical protein
MLSLRAAKDTKHARTTSSQQNTPSTRIKQCLVHSPDLGLYLKDHVLKIIVKGPLI